MREENGASIFGRLSVSEHHMLFRTHVVSLNIDVGLMWFITKTFNFFKSFFFIWAWTALASRTKPAPIRFSEKKNRWKSVDFTKWVNKKSFQAEPIVVLTVHVKFCRNICPFFKQFFASRCYNYSCSKSRILVITLYMHYAGHTNFWGWGDECSHGVRSLMWHVFKA